MSDQPKRIQRRRVAGWTMPSDAVYVGRPTRWGNPFAYRHRMGGLVRHVPSTPSAFEFEGRISADGMRHPYFHPDGTVTDYLVRWATRSEIVELYRRTLLQPDRGMVGAWPSRAGRFLEVSADDVRGQLAGRDLACWCPIGQPCHADVLLEVANSSSTLDPNAVLPPPIASGDVYVVDEAHSLDVVGPALGLLAPADGRPRPITPGFVDGSPCGRSGGDA